MAENDDETDNLIPETDISEDDRDFDHKDKDNFVEISSSDDEIVSGQSKFIRIVHDDADEYFDFIDEVGIYGLPVIYINTLFL